MTGLSIFLCTTRRVFAVAMILLLCTILKVPVVLIKVSCIIYRFVSGTNMKTLLGQQVTLSMNRKLV